jgi:protein ImuA
MSVSSDSRQALLARLRQQVAEQEGSRSPIDERPISTGISALDRLLPAGGLRRGTLVEYLSPAAASGAGLLALSAAREACREGRALVVLDHPPPTRSASEGISAGHFYPPAAVAWGIDLARMLVLRPATTADALWAFDQALRCPGVGAVFARYSRLASREFRRLQLAAESGGTVGLLLRPATARGQPTWAGVRWQVARDAKVVGESKVESRKSKVRGGQLSTLDLRPPTWKIVVELVRCRGGTEGRTVVLELDEAARLWREVSDHATHTVPVPAPVADPTSARRA